MIDEFKNSNFGVWGWILNENVGKIIYIIVFFLIIAGCSMILLTGKLLNKLTLQTLIGFSLSSLGLDLNDKDEENEEKSDAGQSKKIVDKNK